MKLTLQEAEEIYHLAEKMIGTFHEGRFRRELLVSNVER